MLIFEKWLNFVKIFDPNIRIGFLYTKTLVINTSTIVHSYSFYISGQCNCAGISNYPVANDSNVLNDLNDGQFIGVFTCPIAMCVCNDKLNGTVDCYRGNSSASIALFPYLLNGSPVVNTYL